MTASDLTLPASLLAPVPRSRLCPRCGKRVGAGSDPDYVWCVYHGEVFVGAVTLDIPKAGSAGPVFERSRARTVKDQERLEAAFNHRLANVSQGARRAQAWRKKQKREQQAAG